MKLSVINCEHFARDSGTCLILGSINLATCDTCEKRVGIIKPYGFVYATIESEGKPPAAPATECLLCVERLREEWDREWQQKLKAAAVRKTARGYFVPIALYEEALKNRK